MRLLRAVVAVLLLMHLLVVPLTAQTDESRLYFSVTSDRTYQPGERIQINLYSSRSAAMQFRVYRVNDAAKFFSQLQDLHSFGGQAPRLPRQEKGWLERFHAWKHRVWAWIRDFIRAQFSEDSRHSIRLWRLGETEQPKKGPQAEQFAQVPVLNQQQLVSTWKFAAEAGVSSNVTVPVTEKGVYLVEATGGGLRAYTIVVITDLAIITKTTPGRLLCYVVNRATGSPIEGAPMRVWIEQKEVANKATDSQGLLNLEIAEAKTEDVAVLAIHQGDVAVNAPGAWNLGTESRPVRGYTYTDRPVYRPGDTVHFKTIVRVPTAAGYVLPQDRELSLELRDPRSYEVIWQQNVTLSDMGTAHWDYPIPADANLGYYYLNMRSGERYVEGVRFSVQDYKKPEYSVKVTTQPPRVLQGQTIKATIEARYYFGEPVANAKVKWVVHTAPYWPYGRYEDDSDEGGYDEGEGASEPYDTYGGDQESEQSGTLDADGKLQITVPTKVNAKRQDLVYRIEARVTDEGNREISGHGFALATYGSFYLMAEPTAYVYSKGGTATINVTALDYDKKPIATAFRAELARWSWRGQKASSEVLSTSDGRTGADGKGQTKMGQKLGIHDYTDAKVQAGFTDDQAFKALKEGLKDSEGKLQMKPVEGLSDDEIKALIAQVRSLKH